MLTSEQFKEAFEIGIEAYREAAESDQEIVNEMMGTAVSCKCIRERDKAIRTIREVLFPCRYGNSPVKSSLNIKPGMIMLYEGERSNYDGMRVMVVDVPGGLSGLEPGRVLVQAQDVKWCCSPDCLTPLENI